MVYADPVKRLLVTWSDRGVEGPALAHHGARPKTDRGPVLRLLEESARQAEGANGRSPRATYDRAIVLTVKRGLGPARGLAEEMRPHVAHVEVRSVALALDDPSDHAALFKGMAPIAAEIEREVVAKGWQVDVLLSAGTPQSQTIWVVLVQAAVLKARLLQVIPAAFVPDPHPRAIREVSLEIEGFPEIRGLREEVSRLRAEVRVRGAKLVTESEAMRELVSRIVRIARSDIPVLVTGETGSGKELVARALHDGSPRSSGPFVAENCGALAESILASELFGHEASAFTGARTRHRGLFEQAHGGTIFLDEVGELPPQVQAMLLRVLQEGTLRRVGGERAIRVDVRIVAATNRDLLTMVETGQFREDLYYRLRGASLRVPSLRERPSDIPALVSAFLEETHAPRGRRARTLSVTPAALRRLGTYRFPGNVRELRSEVQRWAVFCDDVVDVDHLAPEINAQVDGPLPRVGAAPEPRPSTEATLAEVVREAERGAIVDALRAHSGNLSRMSAALGIERNTLKRKLRSFGLYPTHE